MASSSCSRSQASLLLKRWRTSSPHCRIPPHPPPPTPVHHGAVTASVTFTPPVQRRFMSDHSSATGMRPSGAYLDDPAKRDTRFGLLKVFLTVITGLSIGAWVSQKMAAFLEENELFVPEDDDDDDDDDDWAYGSVLHKYHNCVQGPLTLYIYKTTLLRLSLQYSWQLQ